jgi:DNA-binding IscR family transcriptional regulator
LEYQGFRKEYVHCEVIRHWEIESRYRQDLRSFTLTRLANNYRVEYAKAKNPCNANTYHSSR